MTVRKAREIMNDKGIQWYNRMDLYRARDKHNYQTNQAIERIIDFLITGK